MTWNCVEHVRQQHSGEEPSERQIRRTEVIWANDVFNFRPHEKAEEKEMLEVMNTAS